MAITWDPTFIDSMPAQLWVDGEHIGDTYAGIKAGWSNTAGYVEFGDFLNADGGNTMWEVDWLRFGNDLVVVPEPVSMLLLLGGFGGMWLRRR